MVVYMFLTESQITRVYQHYSSAVTELTELDMLLTTSTRDTSSSANYSTGNGYTRGRVARPANLLAPRLENRELATDQRDLPCVSDFR